MVQHDRVGKYPNHPPSGSAAVARPFRTDLANHLTLVCHCRVTRWTPVVRCRLPQNTNRTFIRAGVIWSDRRRSRARLGDGTVERWMQPLTEAGVRNHERGKARRSALGGEFVRGLVKYLLMRACRFNDVPIEHQPVLGLVNSVVQVAESDH